MGLPAPLPRPITVTSSLRWQQRVPGLLATEVEATVFLPVPTGRHVPPPACPTTATSVLVTDAVEGVVVSLQSVVLPESSNFAVISAL